MYAREYRWNYLLKSRQQIKYRLLRSSVKDVAKYPSFLFKPIKAYK